MLLPSADGNSRVVAYELLFVNSAVANLIRDKKTFQIPSVMQLGRAQGMITLGQCLGELSRNGKITPELAKRYAPELAPM
jgi:twitching motility protein PilT